MRKIIFVILLACLLLTACSDSYQLKLSESASPYTIVNNNIVRIIDEEAGVVCWIYSHSKLREGGISCLPLDETNLQLPK